MMNGGPIPWKSRRQDNLSLSTSEAEFVAASLAGRSTYVKRLPILDFLKLKPLFCTKTTSLALR